MITASTVAQMKEIAAAFAPKSVGFVPTMGSLHQGHISLVEAARRENDLVVVSLFVNPTQFAPGEDYGCYPRDTEPDRRLLVKAGVDCLFMPTEEAMYPAGTLTSVYVSALSECLCGELRPGHFQGVTTVVAKLFNLVRPTRAYFGRKDIQQVRIIAQMVADLNIPVVLRFMPTVREPDGLAKSSRNSYLSRSERLRARALSESLAAAKAALEGGNRDCESLLGLMRSVIVASFPERIDYIRVVDPRTLADLAKVGEAAIFMVAVCYGKTRLIDNLIIGDIF